MRKFRVVFCGADVAQVVILDEWDRKKNRERFHARRICSESVAIRFLFSMIMFCRRFDDIDVGIIQSLHDDHQWHQNYFG